MAIKKFLSNKKLRKNTGEEGYVIVAVLGISFLAVIVVSSITAITISDMMFNAKVRAAIESKHAAETALDSYYAAINSDPDRQRGIVQSSERFSVTEGGNTYNPIFVDSVTGLRNVSSPTAGANIERTVNTSGYSRQWFSVNDNGDLSRCNIDDRQTPCFRMRLTETISRQKIAGTTVMDSGVGGSDTRTEYVIDVVVRHKCTKIDNSGNDDHGGCTFSRYQQQMRQREFISHVMLTDNEQLAPTVIQRYEASEGSAAAETLKDRVENNTYASGDELRGNIHTNSPSIVACGGVSLAEGSFITSSGVNQVEPVFEDDDTQGFTACKRSAIGFLPDDLSLTQREFDIPSRAQDEQGTRLRAIAASENASRYVRNSGDRIEFLPDGTVSFNGEPAVSMPASGVIYVNGSTVVHGTVNGKVTVFATQDITVGFGGSTDLRYADSSDTSDDLIGLITPKDIILDCNAAPNSPCQPKTVHGLLVAGKLDPSIVDADGKAAGGTIYNNRWFNSRVPDGGTAPTITLYGSMISGYRGTFGAMGAGSYGAVGSGWRKNFAYDKRLRYEQPPYMLRDALARYIRSASKDMQCDDYCTSQITNENS